MCVNCQTLAQMIYGELWKTYYPAVCEAMDKLPEYIKDDGQIIAFVKRHVRNSIAEKNRKENEKYNKEQKNMNDISEKEKAVEDMLGEILSQCWGENVNKNSNKEKKDMPFNIRDLKFHTDNGIEYLNELLDRKLGSDKGPAFSYSSATTEAKAPASKIKTTNNTSQIIKREDSWYIIEAVPGATKDTIKAKMDGDVLVITGTCQSPLARFGIKDQKDKVVSGKYTLNPDSFDYDNIQMYVDRGQMVVRLPFPPASKRFAKDINIVGD